MTDLDEATRPLPDGHHNVAQQLFSGLAADPRVRCVLLTGSLATGHGDLHSDLDLSVVVPDSDSADSLAAHLPSLLDDVVHHQELSRGPVRIVSLITTSWARADVLIEPAAVARRRHQPPHVVLLDHDGLTQELLHHGVPKPDPDALPALVSEFLRVLGLLDVSIGRGEHFVGMQGVMLLRQHLLDLFRASTHTTDGAGHKRHPWLTAAQRATLDGQPPLTASSSSIIDGHRAAAESFLPAAHRLMVERGHPWPEAFERATLAHLYITCGLHLAPSAAADDSRASTDHDQTEPPAGRPTGVAPDPGRQA